MRKGVECLSKLILFIPCLYTHELINLATALTHTPKTLTNKQQKNRKLRKIQENLSNHFPLIRELLIVSNFFHFLFYKTKLIIFNNILQCCPNYFAKIEWSNIFLAKAGNLFKKALK